MALRNSKNQHLKVIDQVGGKLLRNHQPALEGRKSRNNFAEIFMVEFGKQFPGDHGILARMATVNEVEQKEEG